MARSVEEIEADLEALAERRKSLSAEMSAARAGQVTADFPGDWRERVAAGVLEACSEADYETYGTARVELTKHTAVSIEVDLRDPNGGDDE